jgi:hypothetical protein
MARGRSPVGPLSIALLTLVVLGVGVALYWVAVLPPTVPPGAAELLLAGRPLLGPPLVFAVVGVLIVRRQVRNAVGWILLGAAISFAVPQVATVYVTSAEYSPAGAYPIPGVVGLVGNVGFAIAVWLTLGLLPLLFPDGRPLTRRWAWVVRFGAAALVVWQVTRALDPGAIVSDADATTPIASPIGIASAAALLTVVSQLAVLAVLATLIPGIVSVVLRYRRGTVQTRLQLRWFLAACLVMLLVTFLPFLQALLDLPALPVVAVMAAGYSLAPIAIGLAVARYRLYDIDVLINRTLVYGATTAAIGAAFFGGIVVLQTLLRPFIAGSEIAVAGSTLASFGLFQPLRRRIQHAVDRRFYRSRYDAARTVDDFSARLRDQVDLDAVRADLVRTASEAMQPDHAGVWLRERAR